MQQRKSDTGIAAELKLVFSPEEEAPDFLDTVPRWGARDEDAELSSREKLIQVVLNGNAEASTR